MDRCRQRYRAVGHSGGGTALRPPDCPRPKPTANRWDWGPAGASPRGTRREEPAPNRSAAGWTAAARHRRPRPAPSGHRCRRTRPGPHCPRCPPHHRPTDRSAPAAPSRTRWGGPACPGSATGRPCPRGSSRRPPHPCPWNRPAPDASPGPRWHPRSPSRPGSPGRRSRPVPAASPGSPAMRSRPCIRSAPGRPAPRPPPRQPPAPARGADPRDRPRHPAPYAAYRTSQG